MRSLDQRRLNAVQRPEAYREVLIDSGGAPVALSVWEGTRGLPAVVFLPGTMTHPLFYEEFLDALNRHGLSVVGLHAAGHGKSPRTKTRLTFELMVTNACDAVTWTRTSYPTSPVAVVGSSQGGIVAMAVAHRSSDVAAVFAHNVLDPALPASVAVTRGPIWMRSVHKPVLGSLGALGRLLPRLPVPFGLYLEMRRVTEDTATADLFRTDPLGLRSYPLSLLTSILAEDPTQPARCPVTVVAAANERLFTLDYTRQVFDRIDAPSKELVVIDTDKHLVFNESLDLVLPELLPRLHALAARR